MMRTNTHQLHKMLMIKKERMLKIADPMTEGKLYDKLHVLVHPSSLKVYHYITRRKSNSYRHCHLHLSTES